MKQVSTSLSTGDPELMDLIGVIASRLIENMPDSETQSDERKDALLERALIYAAQAEQQIASQNQRIEYLQSLSCTDELTGLLNRRGFTEQLGQTLAAARRFGHTGVLVYCDLDNFKEINDLHAYCVGDRVPKRVAEVARHSLRDIDTIARLGGDEFAMLIAQTKWADGQKRAQTLQWPIENTPTDELPKTKVSLGIEH